MSQPLAMLLSIAIEAAVAAVLIGALRWGSAGRAAAAATVGTLLTHWFAWQWSPPVMAVIGDIPGFIAVEACVALVESGIYRFLVPLSLGHALVLSLAANGSSAALGIVLAAFNLVALS